MLFAGQKFRTLFNPLLACYCPVEYLSSHLHLKVKISLNLKINISLKILLNLKVKISLNLKVKILLYLKVKILLNLNVKISLNLKVKISLKISLNLKVKISLKFFTQKDFIGPPSFRSSNLKSLSGEHNYKKKYLWKICRQYERIFKILLDFYHLQYLKKLLKKVGLWQSSFFLREW